MLFNLILQQGPIETTNYMIAGYTVIFGVMAIYLVSLFLRRRNLQREHVKRLSDMVLGPRNEFSYYYYFFYD